MCGVKTNIVTAVEIHDQWAGDAKMLPALVDATAQNFQTAEVSADKVYGSRRIPTPSLMSVPLRLSLSSPIIEALAAERGRRCITTSNFDRMNY
jgi:hypothetical protein